MIVSETPKRSNSRWLQICVLLCAVVVLPLGIASAQDYEAVERRLGVGVAEGELTLKQASVMMDALKKTGGAKKDQGPDRAEAYLMKVKKELGALVEAGRISKEDAARRYEGAEKGIKARMAGRGERQRGDDKQREYEGFERRIKAAVREGKMTREEAGEQLKGFRRRMEMAERGERGERRITREDYARAEAELDKAVAEGRISKEDAKARLNGMRREMAERGQRGITIEEYRRAEAKMRKMIEDGKAKPEDVERRLIEMRKMIRDQSKRGGERQRTARGDKPSEYEGFERRIKAAVRQGIMSREEAGEQLKGFRRRLGMAEQGERGERRISREDAGPIVARLKKAVAEGKISEEDAKARLNGLRRMIAAQGKRQRGDERQRTTRSDERAEYEGFERRIKAAVEAGKMTREEAGEKLEDYKKRIGR